jgi:organic hydroperoxide reductase OsmC/OhrA
MTHYVAQVRWNLREGEDFARGRYSRGHILAFDGGAEIAASSSPHSVPAPWSVEAAVDPEELLVAAIADCHMLTFLHKARDAGFQVTRYQDEAAGVLEADNRGRLALTRVMLRPVIGFLGPVPGAEASRALHEAAHRDCFIANSVKSQIEVEPRNEPA